MISSDPNDDRIWRALADPVRRALLDALATAPRTTGDLVETEGQLCRTAVMKHLDVLVTAGLVVRRERRLDFHSLRVTFGTMLTPSGTALPTAMELMRHSDARLTTRV